MDEITMAHGNGGKIMDRLIEELFFEHLNNQILLQKDDSSILPEIEGQPVISTDSFVVNPVFFPGGDIGKLAISGTVNDIAMSGARPLYITTGFILEEGFKINELKKVIKSIAETAGEAGVKVVAGDTKVVERGKGDKIFINTTGIGVIEKQNNSVSQKFEKGDKIIINGTIGDHGLTILKERKDLQINCLLRSDCTVLTGLISNVLQGSEKIKFLRDPTRGGLATVLNEIAVTNNIEINIYEEKIPLKNEVRSLCKMLGLDPLYLPNEGKVVVIVAEEESEKVLGTMREHEKGKQASIIGSVTGEGQNVILRTKIGGRRIVNRLIGDMLPRIC